MKLIGAAIVIAVSTRLGFMKAESLNRRANLLEQLCSGLEILKSEIAYSGTDLEKALIRAETLTDSGGLFKAAAEDLGAVGISAAWEKAVEERIADKGDRAAIERLGAVLGKTDARGQTEHISYTAALVRARAKDAKAAYAKYGRLYKSVGVLAGAAAVLILL